jgi:CRISPR type III-associated protein (TIGR04423 family)
MRFSNKSEVIEYINSLDGYEGYVQFSHRAIEKEKDIFLNKNPKVSDEEGFVYEAHFYKDNNSISIKQINNSWVVSKTDILNVDQADMQKFITDIAEFNYEVKMAQIWEDKEDEYCEHMMVKRLKKVVFAGFEGGKS